MAQHSHRVRETWPPLRLSDWRDTYATLHMWTQIVGKIRLALSPAVNHWWHIPLYVTSRGLTTSPMPYDGRAVQIDFDFVDHLLRIEDSSGDRRSFPLESFSVAEFYRRTMEALMELNVDVSIWPVPVEVGRAVPLDRDEELATYDGEYAARFWHILILVQQVFERFRGRFLGKVSPVHFFWGAFDLAVTRFSGREAPPHPGGIPNVGDWVMREAYSHEVSSAGFWPGAEGLVEEAAFYSYAYPEPRGFREAAVQPAGAFYHDTLREFVLPYEAIRAAGDVEGALMEFLQSTYEAAADLAGWDRSALEREPVPA